MNSEFHHDVVERQKIHTKMRHSQDSRFYNYWLIEGCSLKMRKELIKLKSRQIHILKTHPEYSNYYYWRKITKIPTKTEEFNNYYKHF